MEPKPYSKAFNRDCSSKFIIEGSIRQSRRRNFGNTRKKCSIISISVPQLHVGLTQSLKL